MTPARISTTFRRRGVFRVAAALLGSALLADVATAEFVRVAGQVVDASGHPVARAEISSFWFFMNGQRKGRDAFVTDDDGRFFNQIDAWGDRFPLIAFTPNGRETGFVAVDRFASDRIVIRLEPAVKVSGRAVHAEVGLTPEWLRTEWSRDGVVLAACNSDSGRFELRLPTGLWNWDLRTGDYANQGTPLLLTSERGRVDLGELEIPASFAQRYQGKAPPEWSITESRGLPADRARLADYRGKWVLIEFWNYG